MDRLELVAPAGSLPHLKAAINGGADAVYLGYKKFGARFYAENFDLAGLKRAAEIAEKAKVKIYLTLNTLIKNSEIEELVNFLNNYINICNDGILIQDFGLYKIIKDLFPIIPLHTSTQLNIHNTPSVELIKKMGFKRVVLAREMTLNEIKEIVDKRILEVEIFGHGSMCSSYSGNCYFSSFVGGRSGNRGRCTQPCRMKYKLIEKNGKKYRYLKVDGNFLLSKSDLFTLNILPQIIKSGIDALKIEGRMKSPEYVGIVTKIYRKYIDRYYLNPTQYKVEEDDLYKLTQIFSRELGNGYLKDKYPKEIISFKKSGSVGNLVGRIYKIEYEKNKEEKRIKSIYIKSRQQINSEDVLEVWTNKGNEHIKIKSYKIDKRITDGRKKIIIYKIPIKKKTDISINDRVFRIFDKKLDEEAKKLYKDVIFKTGKKNIKNNFSLTEKKIRDYLTKNLLQKKEGLNKPINNKLDFSGPNLIANVYDLNNLKSSLNGDAEYIVYSNFYDLFYGNKSGIIFDEIKKVKNLCDKDNKNFMIDIPFILYDEDIDMLKERFYKIFDANINSFQVSNLGALNILDKISQKENFNLKIFLSSSFNLFNSFSIHYFKNLINNNFNEGKNYKNINLKGVELSPELNLNEIKTIISNFRKDKSSSFKFSIFSYGFFPVLTSRYKINYISDEYDRKKEYYLEDIKGYKFRVSMDNMGNMVVFNSKKICTIFDLEKIYDAKVDLIEINTRYLKENETYKILKSYKKAINILSNKGIQKYREFVSFLKEDILFKNYTRGHLFRGVD